MNINHGVSDDDISYNKVTIKCFPDGGVLTSIKFKLETDYIQEIIDGKKTKDSYINLLGILYNINRLRDINDYASYELAQKKLYDFKIYTSIELRKRMQDSRLKTTIDDISNTELIEQSKLPEEIIDNLKLISDYVKLLRAISDSDIDYINKQLKTYNQSVFSVTSFMVNLMGVPFYEMKDISQEKQRDLFIQIKDLLNRFLEEQSESTELPKIKIEKF